MTFSIVSFDLFSFFAIVPEDRLSIVLLIIPLLYLYYRLDRYRKIKIASYQSLDRYRQSPLSRDPLLFWVKSLAISLAFIACSLSISTSTKLDTAGYRPKKSSSEEPSEILFLVDVSRSMSAVDVQENKSRLERAKEAVRILLEHLSNVNVSLAAFAGNADMLVPSTEDYLALRTMADNLQIDEPGDMGTDMLQAVAAIENIVKDWPYSSKISIILLSDGEDSLLLSETESQKSKRQMEICKKIEQIARENVRWFTVGVGSKSGAPVPKILYKNQTVTSKLNQELLEKIAACGNGLYFSGEAYGLKNLADTLKREIVIRPELAKLTQEQEIERVPDTDASPEQQKSLAMIAIACLVLVLFLPDIAQKRQESS